MRVNLNVPFSEKGAAKRSGAKWDPGRRTWYVENKEDLRPFLRWMPKHLLKPVEGPQKKRGPPALFNDRLPDGDLNRLRDLING